MSDIEYCLPSDESGVKMNAIWAGIFRRDFLINNHLYFNENMIAQEDTLFYYELSLRANSIIKMDIPCYLYRQRNGSVMHTRSKERAYKYYLSMVELLKVYERHLEEGDYNDETILKRKILHMKQNVISCLASVDDSKFVKRKLRELKSNRNYPYRFRMEALQTKESVIRIIVYFLLPIEPVFWTLPMIYKISYMKDRGK